MFGRAPMYRDRERICDPPRLEMVDYREIPPPLDVLPADCPLHAAARLELARIPLWQFKNAARRLHGQYLYPLIELRIARILTLPLLHPP